MKYFRIFFEKSTGFKELELRNIWRRSSARNLRTAGGTERAMQRFSYAVRLRLDSLSVFSGLAPTVGAGKELIQSGAILMNGIQISTSYYVFNPKDILQFVLLSLRTVATDF